MLSALDDEQHDPHGVPKISPEVVLVARAAADFPSLAPDARGHHDHAGSQGADVPKVDTTFRASDTSGELLGHGKWLRSAAMAFLFALCSALAAAGWQRYGDEARAMFSDFTPPAKLSSFLPSSLIPGRTVIAAQPDAPATPPAVTADQAAQSPPAAQQTADSAAPAPAPSALPPETEQLLQSMARDVASLNQQIGELKARITELKTGQAQLSHEMAKMSEARVSEPRVSEARQAEPRPAKLGAPPRPLGTLVTHRPKPPSYPQAAYVPPPPPRAAPVQIAPPPATLARPNPDAMVVRPPMPVQ